MFDRRGLMLLSMTILLSCGGTSLDAVTGGGDSSADRSSAGGTSGSAGTASGSAGGTSGSAGGTTGSAGGTSGGAGGTTGTGGRTVADASGDHGSGGADAGNDTVSLPDAAIDHPQDAGSCPASVPITGSYCSATDLGTMCVFKADAGGYSCTCSAGDLITVWKCTKSP